MSNNLDFHGLFTNYFRRMKKPPERAAGECQKGGESMCTYLEVISMTFSGFLLGVALCNFIYVRDLFPKQRESRDNDVGNRSNKHED